MESPESENIERWHAWRAACEQGRDWATSYDLYLHPDTRIPLERVLAEMRLPDGGSVTA